MSDVAIEDKFFLLFEDPPALAALAMAMEGAAPDRERLRSALGRTLRKHPKAASRLRTEGFGRRERLHWELVPDAVDRALRFEDLTTGASLAALAATCEAMLREPLDAREGPLVDCRFYEGSDDHVFVIRFHHALTDGIGLFVFLADLFDEYNETSRPMPVAPPSRDDWDRSERRRRRRSVLGFHWRRSLEHRFAPPDKAFDPRGRSPGRPVLVARRQSTERTKACAAAARAAGITLNDLLVAAVARGVAAAKASRGLGCGTQRILVNQNLRRSPGDYRIVENRSSTIPLWVGPADRREVVGLTRTISAQVKAARVLDIARSTLLLATPLRLPLAWARRFLLPLTQHPRLCDSFVVSNLGRVPHPAVAPAGGYRWGACRARTMLPTGIVAAGVGLFVIASSFDDALTVSVNAWDGWFSRAELDRAADEILAAFEEIAADLEGAEIR